MDESETFRQLWHQRYEIQGVNDKLKRFLHPQLGMISLRQINWWSASNNGDRMLVYMPSEEQDKQLLEKLSQLDFPV
ncbi:hypothetical protein [Brenneria sp. L3-3Z]|uniref:MmyB family transcriptional regulator n=1 Tax=Brenneria sp. L3-3Z TaxID=3094864 RepID=UPI0032EABDB3